MPAIRIAIALCCLAILGGVAASRTRPSPAPTFDVSGRYTSNYDDVHLTQRGDRVTGSYVCCGGGTIDGRILDGRTRIVVADDGLTLHHHGYTENLAHALLLAIDTQLALPHDKIYS